MTAANASIPHVAVVGGGVTGLAAAARLLARSGPPPVRVTLVEAAARLGGKVRTTRTEGLLLEEGPDSFLAMDAKPWARDLCRELGLERELYATPAVDRHASIYHAGRLHPLPAGMTTGLPGRLGPFLATGLLTPGGKVRALADLVLPRTLGATADDVSVGALLRRRLGDELVDRLVEPLLAGIYAGNIDALSMDAVFPALRRQEATRRSLILATLAQARAARRRPPSATPPPPPFLSLRHGLDGMVEALAGRVRSAPMGRIVTASPVRRIDRDPDGRYTLQAAGLAITVDRVVVAVPAPEAARLLTPLEPHAARALASVPYADVALVMLAYDRADVGRIPHGSGFLVPRGEDVEASACTVLSAKWPASAPPETVLLRVYLGRAGDGVLNLDDAALLGRATATVSRTMGIVAPARLARVVRLPAALPQYTVGHLDRIARIEAAVHAALPGVVVTGSAFRGVGLPDCVHQGQAAAETVLASLRLAVGTAGAS